MEVKTGRLKIDFVKLMFFHKLKKQNVEKQSNNFFTKTYKIDLNKAFFS